MNLLKVKYDRDINCNKCGSNNTVFVYSKKRDSIFLRCLDCKKERDLTHVEGKFGKWRIKIGAMNW